MSHDTLYTLPALPTKDDTAETLAEYVQYIEKACKWQWLTFNHPKFGKVPGRCIACKHRGDSQPGSIMDFTLTIEGQSKTTRNTVEVSMVDSRAQFRESRQHAIDECK